METRAYVGISRLRNVAQVLIIFVLNEAGHKTTSNDQNNVGDTVALRITKPSRSAFEIGGTMDLATHSAHGLDITP